MRRRIRPDIERLSTERVESPHIIQSHDVIGVGVRENDRIDAINIIIHTLKTQFRGCIDKHAGRAVRNQHGRPSAFIVRIGASANLAMAADHGHPGAGTGAEEQKLDIHGVFL